MDLILAVALLLLVVALEIAFWNTHVFDIEARQSNAELQRTAFDASNYLVKNKLVSKSNIFEPEKVLDFISDNYSDAKHDIGVSGYEFYFKLEDTEGSILQLNSTDIEFGGNFSTAENLAVVRRIGLIDINETKTGVIGYIYLWK